MSTTAPGGDPVPARTRFLVMLGHYADLWLIVLAAAGIVATLLRVVYRPATPLGRLTYNAPLLVIACVGIAALTAQVCVHNRRLCPRDISDAPLTDPGRVVAARMRELAFYHAHWVRLLATVFALAVTGNLLANTSRGTLFPLPLALIAVVGLAVTGYNAYVDITHRRLEPWCPWCSDDDWDDGDLAPEPTPDPAGERSR